jgi:Ca-activated chloride channel family protein
VTFATPAWLISLLIVPAAMAAYTVARRRRARRVAVLATQGLAAPDGGRFSRWRRHLPFALFAVGLALLAVATARPMASVKTPKLESTVILTMDVSNSMGAKDVKPTRVGAAELAASTFVREQPSSVKIGVVAFGPSALVVHPPTFDHAAVLTSLKSLSLGGGTSLATGILTSLDAIAGKTLKVDPTALNQDNSNQVDIGYFGGTSIVLFSDGEDTSQADPVAMAKLASVAGVRIQAIGVGTAAGTSVDIDGFSVATALDEQTLKAVAQVTNGQYHQIDDRAAIADVSKSINLHFAVVTEYIQISALFVAGAVLFLAVGALLSVLWFGRVM